MNALTLRHFRYFEALAQHGHFGRAAEACGVSQPALSIQMKELEEIVGLPLVERSARQVRLTGFGEVFLLRVRDILRSVEELASLARTGGEELSGRLRVGVIPTVAPYLLPRVIEGLSERFPDLDLRLREAVTQKLVGDLIEGRLDVAIVALPISEPSLEEQQLFTEEFVLVRPLADAEKPVPPPKACGNCDCFCWRRGIVSAIRPLPSASFRPPARGTSWKGVPCPRSCRWWERGSASP
jgi:LysR family transcriptional regulator, hydrogen peroxide-inducible genes activator